MTEKTNGAQVDIEKIADLINKCLALSDSPNENEATLAMSKAQELLEKYNLSLQDIRDRNRRPDDMIEGEIEYDGYYWRRKLYSMVARRSNCTTVIHPYKNSVSILGRQTNVMTAMQMIYWLYPQINTLWREEINKTFRPNSGVSYQRVRDSIACGIIDRIEQRLIEQEISRQDSNPDLRALVISLEQEANDYKHEVYPSLRQAKAKALEYGAYQNGVAAGNRASIVSPSHHVDGGPLRLKGGM